MRVLLVTWDGAGNLPPALAVISALHARGHEVIVLGHDSQEREITRSGGTFLRFPTAGQLDQGKAQPVYDFNHWFADFNKAAAQDLKEETARLKPDVLVVDCMMGPSLQAGKLSKVKLVTLVHVAYSAMSLWSNEISGADLALCCSYAGFDVGAIFPKNMVFIGPLRPVAEKGQWTRKFSDRPLVIANLSSGHQGSFQPKVLQRLCDALSMLPVEGLVTTGRGIAPEEMTAGSNVSVERNVDHGLTLPMTSLFINHCGHGSVMASLRAGVPMLCMPPIADQPHNANLVKSLRLGEVISVMASADAIAEATARLLADNGMRARAKEFAEKCTYEPKIDEAVQLIEALGRRKTTFLSRLGFGKG
jgi:UDP:flavonoid glycosyltransferase YjiC (YdhE family)